MQANNFKKEYVAILDGILEYVGAHNCARVQS